jgi:adenosylcobinamide-GDP ribazoletransferase
LYIKEKIFIKRLFKGFFMSMGMFTAIPTPFSKWEDRATNLVIPFFPAVGGVIGGIWFTTAYLLQLTGLSVMLKSAIIMLMPLLLSGFLHIDGFMDTTDAIFSRRDLSEKRRILKDSHVGAFAVIALAVLFLISFCSVHTFVSEGKNILVLLFIPVLSRCVTGVAVLRLKLISENSYAALFRKDTKPVYIFVLAATAILCVWLATISGGVIMLAPLLVLISSGCLAAVYVYKELDGISGDLSGFILTVSELCAIMTAAVL